MVWDVGCGTTYGYRHTRMYQTIISMDRRRLGATDGSGERVDGEERIKRWASAASTAASRVGFSNVSRRYRVAVKDILRR